MINQPIKLSDNLSLYSGDVITINNSNPLLVEVLDNEVIKLRNINDNEYIYKSKFPLKPLGFTDNFDKASSFIVKINNDTVSLQVGDKYLEIDGKKLSFSSK